MNLRKMRDIIEHNKKLSEKYDEIIRNLQEKLESSIIKIREEDEVFVRQIGVCDYYRHRYPNSDLTDEQIIKRYEDLEKNWESCN